MKRADYEPLSSIEETRKRLGAPRVNISVLWTVVTQLASDLRWALTEIDALLGRIRSLEAQLSARYGPEEPTYYVAPVGGSDPSGAVDPTQTRLFE